MKKLTELFLYLFIVFTGCNDPKPSSTSINNSAKQDGNQQLVKFNGFLDRYDKTSQRFVVSADKATQINGKKGTIISINPSDLETIEAQPVG